MARLAGDTRTILSKVYFMYKSTGDTKRVAQMTFTKATKIGEYVEELDRIKSSVIKMRMNRVEAWKIFEKHNVSLAVIMDILGEEKRVQFTKSDIESLKANTVKFIMGMRYRGASIADIVEETGMTEMNITNIINKHTR